MLGRAPTYEGEVNMVRRQTGGTGLDLRGLPVTACPRHPKRHTDFLPTFVDHRPLQTSLNRRGMQPIKALMKYRRLKAIRSLKSHHDHERIRGTVPVPNPITASNLRRHPGTRAGTTAQPTLLGGLSIGWCDDDDTQGNVASHSNRNE